MTAERDKKQTYMQKKVVKGMKNVSFLHGRRKHRVLAFGIVTCTSPEVTLLSEEFLYTGPYSEFDTLYPSFIMYSWY